MGAPSVCSQSIRGDTLFPRDQTLELSQAKFYLVPQQKLPQPRELAGPVPTPAAATKQCLVLTKERQTTASSSPSQAGTRRRWLQTPREPDRRGKGEEGVTADSQAGKGPGRSHQPGKCWGFFSDAALSVQKKSQSGRRDKGVLRGFSPPSASLSLVYPQVT